MYSGFQMRFQTPTTKCCVWERTLERSRSGQHTVPTRYRSQRHFLLCGGHRGWCFHQEVSQVYVFGRLRLNKGFNGHHVGSYSPSILMRDPFVFSKSARGTSDVTSTKVKVYKAPVLCSRVGCRDIVALSVCVSIAGQSSTAQAQQLPQLQ